MNIVRIEPFQGLSTKATIYLRDDMLRGHMFVHIVFKLAGIATVYTLPLAVRSLHLRLYFQI